MADTISSPTWIPISLSPSGEPQILNIEFPGVSYYLLLGQSIQVNGWRYVVISAPSPNIAILQRA